MERDQDTLLSLIDFLRSHGYPEASIVMEWPINRKYRADLAVIDPDTNKLIALFELKRRKTTESFKMALKQLETFSNVLGKEQVPVYAVFGREGEPPFEIYYLQKGDLIKTEDRAIKVSKVPDYTIFKTTKRQKMIFQSELERKSTLNSFQIMCWIMAALLFILLISDFRGLISINIQRLILIGAVIGLIIVPFASKLKILGVEFERLQEKE